MLEYIKIYPGTIDLVKRYPAADRCLLYEAVMEYAFKGSLPEWPQDDLKWLVWELLRAKVDSADAARINGRRAGLASAAQRQQAATGIQHPFNTRSTPVEQPADTPATGVQPNIDIDIENDIDIDIDKGKRTRTKTVAMNPPSVEQVTAYCTEKGLQVDAERFVAYYTANGWKVGKNPMKNWQAAVRTWVRNGYDTPARPAKVTPQTDYAQRGYTETPAGAMPEWLREELAAEEQERTAYLAQQGLADTPENRKRAVKEKGEWRLVG